MTQWRNQGIWSKAGALAWLTVLALITCGSDASGLGGGSSSRKRVFSPGLVVFCVFVAVFELIALNHLYGVRMR
ncbi:hypothetical protein EX349_06565 [Pseudomonas protegens]|nr:hypothetical protein [Pseudomonas protegens]NAN50855.1 hypothetical protein [Pseudomonas protegens]NUE77370.1 hypothetical protein [Pseudomonas protegens]